MRGALQNAPRALLRAMRRGLISWSRDEVPASTLDARLGRLQEEMRAAGLDAVLAYCSIACPAVVSYLTHFVPYWNEALLVVFPAGAPVLLAAFSKRVHPWIQGISHVGEVLAAPQLGRAAVALLDERLSGFESGRSRIGVVELNVLPWAVAEPIEKGASSAGLIDATELFAGIRQPADAAEIGLAQRAADIAAEALSAIPGN